MISSPHQAGIGLDAENRNVEDFSTIAPRKGYKNQDEGDRKI
ncbi:MAG: hypothetical protein WAO55_14725 [Candidatus Manganitrophaceae bacterium]